MSVAPVGSFGANEFGLFDVHGNVWEWTREGYDSYATPPRSGDGLRVAPVDSSFRVSRGGSFLSSGRGARAAYRRGGAPGSRSSGLGLRPARIITE